MFPYKDENHTEKPAVITVALILANVLAFIFVQGAGAAGPLARSVCDLGLIPGEILQRARPGSGVELAPGMLSVVGAVSKYWTVITSVFMHGGCLGRGGARPRAAGRLGRWATAATDAGCDLLPVSHELRAIPPHDA